MDRTAKLIEAVLAAEGAGQMCNVRGEDLDATVQEFEEDFGLHLTAAQRASVVREIERRLEAKQEV